MVRKIFNSHELVILIFVNSRQRGIEYMLVRRVEDVGLAVAEQLKPERDGYKTIKLSSGKVGKFYNNSNIISYLPYHKMGRYFSSGSNG